MNGDPEGFGNAGVEEIRAHCGLGRDAEQQNENRRHQGAAAHARNAHNRAYQHAGQRGQSIKSQISSPASVVG